MVVETDTDAFFVGLIRCDFVPKPAFEKNEFAGFGRILDEDAIDVAVLWKSWRSRHEFAQSGIFEFDARTAPGRVYVIGATQE